MTKVLFDHYTLRSRAVSHSESVCAPASVRISIHPSIHLSIRWDIKVYRRERSLHLRLAAEAEERELRTSQRKLKALTVR